MDRLLLRYGIKRNISFTSKYVPNASSVRHTPEYAFCKSRPALSQLPTALIDTLGGILKKYPRSILKADINRLLEINKESCTFDSESILNPTNSEDPDTYPRSILEYGDREAIAYITWQMPLAFACLQRIFSEVRTRCVDFVPKKILDFGCGPGTAVWAIDNVWNENQIEALTAIDISESMLALANKMLSTLPNPLPEPKTEFRRFLSHGGGVKSNLTVCAFTLNDLPDDGVRKMTIRDLLKKSDDMMVLVERGTPEGFRNIRNARTQLLEGKEPVYIVSPCSHEFACPMKGSWCHFSQRTEMTKFQMECNPLKKGFEDQKFSYLVVRKGKRPEPSESSLASQSFKWPRIVRRPIKRDSHVINDYCDVDGVIKRVVTPKSQGKQIYYDARKSKWGDLWPHPPKNQARVMENMSIKPSKYSNNK